MRSPSWKRFATSSTRELEGQLYLALGPGLRDLAESPTKAAWTPTPASSNAIGSRIRLPGWRCSPDFRRTASARAKRLATLERGHRCTIGPDAQLLERTGPSPVAEADGSCLPKEKRNWADLDQVLEQRSENGRTRIGRTRARPAPTTAASLGRAGRRPGTARSRDPSRFANVDGSSGWPRSSRSCADWAGSTRPSRQLDRATADGRRTSELPDRQGSIRAA